MADRKTRIKQILKYLLFALLAFLIFVLLYFAAAYILARIEVKAEGAKSADVEVYLLSNGVHTDLVMPIRNSMIDWSKQIKFDDVQKPDTAMKYIAVGWGDKGFYMETPTWSQLKFSVAFKAVFGLSTSAMHTTFYKSMGESHECFKLSLDTNQYRRLINYIQSAFLRDSKGDFINIKTRACYCDDDAFYEAVGVYNLFFTCNTWTNSALKACGQKAALWTPFEHGVLYHYRK